ncbi:MAG: hypothetical protein M5U19_22210 [Microthrixaceae bacterium]|nr:hypothetical protein [Microthrixaceae bacterium]
MDGGPLVPGVRGHGCDRWWGRGRGERSHRFRARVLGAAYLVLVVGVAQIALGAGLAWLPGEVVSETPRTTLATGWNLASVAVVAGTLISAPALTSIGGLVIAASLVGFVVAVTRSRPEMSGWALLYRALALFVLLSTPVGLLLAWIRRS